MAGHRDHVKHLLMWPTTFTIIPYTQRVKTNNKFPVMENIEERATRGVKIPERSLEYKIMLTDTVILRIS